MLLLRSAGERGKELIEDLASGEGSETRGGAVLLFLGDGGLFDDAILLELAVGELERTRFLSAFHLVLLLLGLAVGCLHAALARNVLEVLLVGLCTGGSSPTR